jgi:hypothetical protein
MCNFHTFKIRPKVVLGAGWRPKAEMVSRIDSIPNLYGHSTGIFVSHRSKVIQVYGFGWKCGIGFEKF